MNALLSNVFRQRSPIPKPFHRWMSEALQDAASDKNKLINVDRNGTTLSIQFPPSFSHHAKFDSLWLYSNRPANVHETICQRLSSPGAAFQQNPRIESATLISSRDVLADFKSSYSSLPLPPPTPESCHPVSIFRTKNGISTTSAQQQLLQIQFSISEGENNSNKQLETAYFDLNWLQRWSNDKHTFVQKKLRTEISSSKAISAKTKLTEIEFDLFMAANQKKKDDATLKLLQALFDDGAVVILNAPSIASGPFTPVTILGRAIGYTLSHGSLYGDIFHVKSIQNTNNVAYTSLPLCPHQDLSYYESMPGIQLLHCITMENIKGGESTLIDVMAAASVLRELAPQHFQTLVQCPATFVKQREGACMTYARPHIVLAPSNDDDIMNREIVAVNWSPPFEGPISLPPNMIRPYYAAYAAFERMLDNAIHPANTEQQGHDDLLVQYSMDHTWERKLEPGNVLIFNNRRMLHGRRGFTSKLNSSSGRHLIGAYTNIDDTLNRYRVLLRERGMDASSASVPNVGNGSSILP